MWRHDVERRQLERMTTELRHDVLAYNARLHRMIREAEAMLMQLGVASMAEVELAESPDLGVDAG